MGPRDYSLTRLLHSMTDRAAHGSCPERDYSRNTLEGVFGRPSRGCFLPELRPQAAGLDTTTQGGGGYLAQKDVSAAIVESLRANSVLAKAGAQVFTGLRHNFSITVQTSGTGAAWVAENSGLDVGEVDPVFQARTFTPHSLAATISVSKQLLQQSSSDLENYLRADFGRALAEAIDKAGLNGSGTSNEPVGLLRTAGIGDLALGASGGTLAGTDVAELERMVGAANAPVSAVIVHPTLRKKLRSTPRFATGTVEPIWTDGNTVLGYPALATTNVPSNVTKGSSSDCTSLLLGDFTNMIIGLWNFEVVVDPFKSKKAAMLEIGIYSMADVGVLRLGAFAACQDARP